MGIEDEGDLDPPEDSELTVFLRSSLSEFKANSLNMQISIVRIWKRVFSHLASERISVCSLAPKEVWALLAEVVQDATLDQRSERLRRPSLDFAACLAKDTAPDGGRAAFFSTGLATAIAAEAGSPAPHVAPPAAWIAKLDPHTAEQEA